MKTNTIKKTDLQGMDVQTLQAILDKVKRSRPSAVADKTKRTKLINAIQAELANRTPDDLTPDDPTPDDPAPETVDHSLKAKVGGKRHWTRVQPVLYAYQQIANEMRAAIRSQLVFSQTLVDYLRSHDDPTPQGFLDLQTIIDIVTGALETYRPRLETAHAKAETEYAGFDEGVLPTGKDAKTTTDVDDLIDAAWAKAQRFNLIRAIRRNRKLPVQEAVNTAKRRKLAEAQVAETAEALGIPDWAGGSGTGSRRSNAVDGLNL